jgi:uncharacterized protein with HEPN domain
VASTRGKTRVDLGSSRLLELALVRLVEVVGEAASDVSGETRFRQLQIPWQWVTSMRHRLAHGENAADFDILWNTIDEDLQPPIGQLETALDVPGTE